MGKGKPFSHQFKPFNFFLVGQATEKKHMKPIAPFNNKPQEAIYKPFINSKNGKILQGEQHWDTRDQTFTNYINHPESKFENGTEHGLLKRGCINVASIQFIGKEIKNLDTEYLVTS